MTKDELAEVILLYREQVEALRLQVESLREDNAKLREQNFRLQDGLMATRAPEAYRDQRADSTPTPELTPKQAAKIERDNQIKELHDEHLRNIENPLFTSAEDMITALEGSLWGTSTQVQDQSIHGNDES
jgi:regulator of replication initiation timing